MPTEVDMVLELLAGGGRLSIDNEALPVWVTVTKDGRQRVVAGGSVSQALSVACRALKAKTKTEDAT